MIGRWRAARADARKGGAAACHRLAFRISLALVFLVLVAAVVRTAAAEEAPPFRLCVDPDNLPFSSKNADTPGFYIELGWDIAARLGRGFEPVWVPTYFGKHAVRTTLLAGHCEGFMGLPEDPDFMGPRVIFSKPILLLGYALVLPQGLTVNTLSDLAGRRVAVQFASPPQSLLATRTDMQPVTVLSPEEGIQKLAQGQADAGFIWGPSAGWIDKTTLRDAYRIVPVAGPHMQWRAAIGFAREQIGLRDQVNGALDALASSTAALMAKYGFPASTPIELAGGGDASGPVSSSAPASAAPDTAPPAAAASQAPAANEAAQVTEGHKLFNGNCSHCHGPDAIQGERRINLRLLRHRHGDEMDQVFLTTVTHGRVTKGMPNWSSILTDEQLRAILAFLHSVQEP